MLNVGTVFALMAVSQLPEAVAWYTRFFARPPDRQVIATDVEWQLTPTSSVLIVLDPERAGRSSLKVAVADLNAEILQLHHRGFSGHSTVLGIVGGVPLRIVEYADPEGNALFLANMGAVTPPPPS